MGDVFWGLHSPIASGLVKAQSLRAAYETGTYFGFGALQLAAMVESVWTVDADAQLSAFCKEQYSGVENITFLQGDSAEQIAEYTSECTVPTLFVLDAHWFPMSPRGGFVPEDRCPVLRELASLANLEPDIRRASALIVDDAQMFLGSLKRPFVRESLPSITEVIDRVAELFPHVLVTDDIIIGCNSDGKIAIQSYLTWRDKLLFP